MLTPRSFDDESHFGSSVSGTPAPDVKPVKKRKSWGQQLPEPKTNLPPRKRAKTEDEKEQRRVERVLRNRRAAQSSRERKRLEVEALEAEKRAIERKNMDLEMRLADVEAKYRLLQQEFERVSGSRTGLRSYSVPNSRTTGLRTSSPISFTHVVNPQDSVTVNPASLSPEIRPVANSTNAYYSDMMQHPAAVLCDLQCQSEEIQLWTNTTTVSLIVTLQILASSESEYQCYEEEILPITTETYHAEYDTLDVHHDGMFDEFVLCDYLNDEPSANERQCSDQLAERSTSLQPQFGASYGCDDGGIAAGI
ncbi:hypothetical protein K3495_g7880 [Podosphaera aphanis]|nr:hypothetical protein K3495_g7880 [Podosphaera aphanis]